MGSSQNKSIKKQLLNDISKVNFITKNDLFLKRTSLSLEFNYCDDYGFIKKIFSPGHHIIVKTVKYILKVV